MALFLSSSDEFQNQDVGRNSRNERLFVKGCHNRAIFHLRRILSGRMLIVRILILPEISTRHRSESTRIVEIQEDYNIPCEFPQYAWGADYLRAFQCNSENEVNCSVYVEYVPF